jgi:hypothetical protein
VSPVVGLFMLCGTLFGAVAVEQRRKIERKEKPPPAGDDLARAVEDVIRDGRDPGAELRDLALDCRQLERGDLALVLEVEADRRDLLARKLEALRAFRELAGKGPVSSEIDPDSIRALRRLLGTSDGDRYDTEAAMAAQAIDPQAPAGEPVVPDGIDPVAYFSTLCSRQSAELRAGAPGGL